MTDNTAKGIMENLGFSKNQGKEINTSELKIKDNAIYYSWSNNRQTALQISNISQIDVGPAPKEKISGIFIAILLIGICLILSKQFLIGLILSAVAGILIFLTIQSNKNAGDNLIIHLNSGSYFLFNFKDKKFLLKVFHLLIYYINHKVSGESIINITNSTIQSSAIGSQNNIK